jgi:hypothetical protein
MTPAMSACGSQPESALAQARPLDQSAWLGSAEDWGLLGLPLDGGPLVYLRAENLESPTWAPPELGKVAGVWPGQRSIWVQFGDARIGRYDYFTGHLLGYEDLESTDIALALERTSNLLIAPGGGALELVGALEEWRFALGGRLARLESAGPGRALAVVETDGSTELVVVEPTAAEALGRRSVEGVLDLAVIPWAERIYYLSGGLDDMLVHGLRLPDLSEADSILLPEPGLAVAATPSGHRLYVSAGDSLHVFDRLRGSRVLTIPLPAPAAALRFSVNGANLMARLAGEDQIAVLQVGVDSLLGVIPGDWDETLPVIAPGGRLIASEGQDLVLYDLPRLVEVQRLAVEDARQWMAVEWQPPRPRPEGSRAPERVLQAAAQRVREVAGGGLDELDPDAKPAAGFYAVVVAARARTHVDNLASWLRSVGYPGVVDEHVDAMGVTWYRGMVGPYEDREAAEESARSLTARYGYKPWILELEGDESDEGEESSPSEEG